MDKEFNISTGTIRVIQHKSSFDVYFWKKDNLQEADNCFCVLADNCEGYTTEENLDLFIANFEYATDLTTEDKKKMQDELFAYFNFIDFI